MMKKRTSPTGLMIAGWAIVLTGACVLAAIYSWPAGTLTLLALVLAVGAVSANLDR